MPHDCIRSGLDQFMALLYLYQRAPVRPYIKPCDNCEDQAHSRNNQTNGGRHLRRLENSSRERIDSKPVGERTATIQPKQRIPISATFLQSGIARSLST